MKHNVTVRSIMKCVRDCTPGSPQDTGGDCGGLANPWDTKFTTALACCSWALSWLDPNECAASTQGGSFFTDKFYVGKFYLLLLSKAAC